MFSKVLIAASLASTVLAGTHVITVNNNCGENFSMQVPGRGNVFDGPGNHQYSYDGDIGGVLAQVGNSCSIDGVGCTSAEFALNDGVSSADITLIPGHVFNHPLRITLTNGETKYCGDANCDTAFHQDGNDQLYQIQESNNPNSGITLQFC